MKRSFDVIVAVLALLVAAPLLLAIAAAIAVGGGAVLFGGRRLGRGGKPFRCLKFRTMAPDAETRLQTLLACDPAAAAAWAAERKLRHDPRVTRLGRWLRATSLDELPQLWNILRGDMAVVGARPIALDEIGIYGQEIGQYIQHRPGLTGLWQVSGRSDLGFSQQARLDARYFADASMRLDLTIIMHTALQVVQGRGAW